jgi:hypothetical protein
MPRLGFELMISVFERDKSFRVLDRCDHLNTVIFAYNIELKCLTCLTSFVFSHAYLINYFKIHICTISILLLFLSLHVSQLCFTADRSNIL